MSLANPVTATFAALTRKQVYSVPLVPGTARNAHLMRLHALFDHLLGQPPSPANAVRLVRAFRVIAQCPELDGSQRWRLGLKVLDAGRADDEEDEDAVQARAQRKVAWLRAQKGVEREKIERLHALALTLADAGSHREALTELETFLPSYPYHDSIELNLVAGLLALYLSQPPAQDTSNSSSSDEASTSTPRVRPSGASQPARPNARAVAAAAQHAPREFREAVEYFAAAAALEKENPQLSRGEGARWTLLLRSPVANSSSDESDSE